MDIQVDSSQRKKIFFKGLKIYVAILLLGCIFLFESVSRDLLFMFLPIILIGSLIIFFIIIGIYYSIKVQIPKSLDTPDPISGKKENFFFINEVYSRNAVRIGLGILGVNVLMIIKGFSSPFFLIIFALGVFFIYWGLSSLKYLKNEKKFKK